MGAASLIDLSSLGGGALSADFARARLTRRDRDDHFLTPPGSALFIGLNCVCRRVVRFAENISTCRRRELFCLGAAIIGFERR